MEASLPRGDGRLDGREHDRARRGLGARGAATADSDTKEAFEAYSTSGWSIRAKLATIAAVVVIGTAVALGGLGYGLAQRVLLSQIEDRLSAELSARQELLRQYIDRQLEAVGLVASRTRLRQLLAAHLDRTIAEEDFQRQLDRILNDARDSTPGFLAIWVTDPAGIVIAANDDSFVGSDLSEDPDFMRGLEQRHFGLPRMSGNETYAFLTGPAATNDGRLLGVVVVHLDLDQVASLFAGSMGPERSTRIRTATRDGGTIHYLLPEGPDRAVTEPRLEDLPAMAAALEQRTGFMRTTTDAGVQVLAAYGPIGYGDWGLVAEIPVREAYQPIYRLRRALIVFDLIILAVAVLGTYLLAGRLSEPILRLAGAATTVSRTKDYSLRVHDDSNDELGVLTSAFNEMLGEIETRNEQLEREIIDRVRAEEAVQFALGELDHRVKNTLATIQSVADHTLESSTDLEEFGKTFRGRIAALGRLHEAMATKNWVGLGLRQLVELSVAPFALAPANGQDRFTIEGEPLAVSLGSVRAIGMAIYELATNAAKHGALSVPNGSVKVSWLLDHSPDRPWLRIDWQEHGGPPVMSPHSRGFGTSLILDAIPYELGGKADIDYLESGVHCAISFPFPGESLPT